MFLTKEEKAKAKKIEKTFTRDELYNHNCPFCGKATHYDYHLTRKEVAEIIVLGGVGTCFDEDYSACPECAKNIQECVASGNLRFAIRSRESGDVLEQECTVEDAQRLIERWEQTDKVDGTFTPDFYEIFDNYTQKIV